MTEPISVGDLVVVVRVAKCGCTTFLGRTFTVGAIETRRGAWQCSGCGVSGHQEEAWPMVLPHNHSIRVLKRIRPLGELRGKKDAADKPITLDGQIERLRKMVQA